MRYILILLLGVTMTAHAQDPHRRRDTIPFMNWQQEITRAPVLTGQEQPIIIVPDRGQYCFDKLLYLKMTIGRISTEQCVYLDTHKGLSGTLPPSRSGGAVTEIMPELENFNFSVSSMKGNIYIYKNHKSKDGIVRNVFTGNTQTFRYQTPTSANPGSGNGMARKAETRGYCDNKITAHAYRYDGGASTWYVYGDRYPEKLHPQKFLGSFGVGYILCQEGLYLVMEMEFGRGSYVRIGQMENVHACFDPSGFKIMEDEFQAKQREELDHDRSNIDREQSKLSGDCIAEKQAVLDYKKAMNDKHAEILRRSQHGNTYQDTIAQRAMLSMLDPEDNVQLGILSAKQGICGAQTDMVNNPRNAPGDGEKIRCLNQQIVILQDVLARMRALDSQYSTHPEIANAKKGQVYYEAMKNVPSCN